MRFISSLFLELITFFGINLDNKNKKVSNVILLGWCDDQHVGALLPIKNIDNGKGL